MRAFSVLSTSPDETRILGAALAPSLLPGDVISLSGELGAGKTVFVQGIASALGVEARVTSPTFTIVHEYRGRYPLVHVDVYRLDSFQEVLDLGYDELTDPEAILIVEWGQAVAPLLPRRFLDVDIRRGPPDAPADTRTFLLRPTGPEWAQKLERTREMAEVLLTAAGADESQEPRFRPWPVPPTRDDRGAGE